MNRNQEQTIALAAIVQAASLVEQLARTGDTAADATTPLLKALFVQSPERFNDVYGSPRLNLSVGLNHLGSLLGQNPKGLSPDVTRYALSLIHLERKLARQPGMLSTLGDGIQSAARQASHFGPAHENTVAALADLYKQTLSNLTFRIHVTGNPAFLQNPHTANRVRAILLSGIRAAILWRQVGGKRWHFLVSRGRYQKACRELLQSSPE
ncbi:high frequency lysogenization protein HflD [Thalassolituus sp. LLYu03]|uniref:high frequency lysogenization protein HflD n=1 Tax=Thalassolituus sp. LLYu03 TaxID=3421656 RepID=UPI003D2E8B39